MNYAAIGLILIAVVSMILSAFWVRARATVCFEPLKTEEKGLGKKLPFNVPLFSKSFLKSPPCSFFDKRDKRELFGGYFRVATGASLGFWACRRKRKLL